MNDELRKILPRHRKARQLSQSQLARLAGVGKTVVFDIEHGKPTVQLDTLQKVLNALDIGLTFQCPAIELTKMPRQKPAQPPKVAHRKEIDTLPTHLL